MMSFGKPFSQYQWVKNSRASSSAVMVVQVGIIRMSEPSLSVIDKIQLKLSSSGRGPMKSIATLSPRSSGIGRGCRGPVGFRVEDLFHRQSVQEGI